MEHQQKTHSIEVADPKCFVVLAKQGRHSTREDALENGKSVGVV